MSQAPVKEVLLHLHRGHLRDIFGLLLVTQTTTVAEKWFEAKERMCFMFQIVLYVVVCCCKIPTNMNTDLQNIFKSLTKSTDNVKKANADSSDFQTLFMMHNVACALT